MENEKELKDLVKQKYGQIALQNKAVNEASCCGSGCCSTEVSTIMNEDYRQLEGYNPEADLGLGCGLPTRYANIQRGDTVIDLGSGAGNDCFIARAETGEEGKVIGIDFTPAMVDKARVNAEKLGYHNVEFRQGDIEDLPVDDHAADVVVSNCVLNLVPNKNAAVKEIFRVLKPGGHFSISDVVLKGNLPKPLQKAAEMYAGCVSGAIHKETYVALIRASGFTQITIQKEKAIVIPDDILRNYLNTEELAAFKDSNTGISSITMCGQKPIADSTNDRSEDEAKGENTDPACKLPTEALRERKATVISI